MSKHSCSRCGESNPKQFWRDNRKGPNGLQTYCKVCSKARRAKWGVENPEQQKKYQRKAGKTEKEPKLPTMAKHLYDQVAENNYRAKQLNPEAGKIKTREWEALLKEYVDGCPVCHRPWVLAGAPTMDHRKPLADGGRNHIRNIQPLCRTCNCRKSKREAHRRARAANEKTEAT